MKLIGAAVVMLFSVFIGLDFSKREKQRLCVCGEISDFLERLRYGIVKRLTVNEIIGEYVKVQKPKYILASSKDELMLLLEKLKRTGVCPRECELCIRTLDNLGKNPDAEGQLLGCSENLEKVRVAYRNLQSEYSKKGDIYVKLGFVCGLALCIAVL